MRSTISNEQIKKLRAIQEGNCTDSSGGCIGTSNTGYSGKTRQRVSQKEKSIPNSCEIFNDGEVNVYQSKDFT